MFFVFFPLKMDEDALTMSRQSDGGDLGESIKDFVSDVGSELGSQFQAGADFLQKLTSGIQSPADLGFGSVAIMDGNNVCAS